MTRPDPEVLRQWRKQRMRGLLEGRPRVGPQTVHFDLANACNTRCTTCWDHSPHLREDRVPSAAWKRQTLPLDRFRAVFDELVAMGGLEAIILSGMGEPLLNPEVYAMVAHAHAHGVGVTIITNLLRLDPERVFATDGQLDLLTSICGVSEPVWQAFHAHPQPDGWATLRRQLEGLRARGFRPKHVQVINGQNFHELVEMVRFAEAFPVKRINFKLASLANGTEAVALTPAQKDLLLADLVPRAAALAEALGIETDLPAFALQIDPRSHRTAPIEDVGCFMGFLYARVTVQGEVLFCCNTRVKVGQLPEEGAPDLAKLWRGPSWQALRDMVRRGRFFPGCEQCGKFKQNVKWSDRLKERLGEQAWAELIGREAP